VKKKAKTKKKAKQKQIIINKQSMPISFNTSLKAHFKSNNLYTLCLFHLIDLRNKLDNQQELDFDKALETFLPTDVFVDFIQQVNFEARVSNQILDLEYRISLLYKKKKFHQ
jgi:uncharacterized protein (DUF2344 family)